MTQGARSDAARHVGFLRHAGLRWLWVSAAIALAAALGYRFADVHPRPSGGTWYGYVLGVAGAVLIVWLATLGIRKRVITQGRWSLKGWVSAHVYLGLALVVVATLHTGFAFGWNVHTLAYILMLVVVASGLFGVVAYVRLPRRLSQNRAELTEAQMLERIHAFDSALDDAAQGLDQPAAAAVRLSLEGTRMGGGFFERLTGRRRGCGNRRAIARLAELRGRETGAPAAELDQIAALLGQKAAALAQARRHISLRAWLQVWLYVHVPATLALLAALTAHIVSVFFYW